MLRTIVSFVAIGVIACGGTGASQEPKKRTGTIIGAVKAQKETKDGKNSIIDVLADGEEKARSYHVVWDAKIKAPIESVLKSVRAAKLGDRVEFDWIETGHGPAITTFKVLKKANNDEKKKDRSREK
jgi:hypothetical protein